MKFNLKRVLTLAMVAITMFLLVACQTTQYTVTFDSHGGEAVASITVEEGAKIIKPNDPSREGFEFAGWFKDSQYEEEWIFETDTVRSNITLHAKWEAVAAQQFTVTFNANGGSAVLPITRTAGSPLGTLPTTTRSGYTFVGWFSDMQLTQAVTANTVVNSNMTIYAKWELIAATTFTVTFNAGGGDVLPGEVTVAEGAKVAEPIPEYLGYELIGWFKDQAFTQPWDFAVDTVTQDITLYAKWELLPEGTAITTVQEFYNLASGTTVYSPGAHFYLKFDLDFKDFEWDASGWTGEAIPIHTFNFNGNGKTLRNLEIDAPNIGGIFPRMSGGSIKDLTIENIDLKTGAQAGVLVGRIMNGSTISITNVVVKNATVEGGNVGVGTLVGHIQGATSKSNVTIEKAVVLNSKVSSLSNAIGGVVGDIESSKLTLKDVLVDVTVETTGERVGALVGEARRNGSSQDLPELFVDGAVIYANLTGLRYLGGVVGRADNNMANLDESIHGATSKVLPGEFKNLVMVLNYDTLHASDNNNGHIARSNVPTAVNAYVFAFNYDRANLNGVNVPSENVFDSIEDFSLDLTLVLNNNWTKVAGQLPTLLGHQIELGHEVTLTVEEHTQIQYVRDGGEISPIYINPALGEFLGWFDGETKVEGAITSDVVLVAKFTEVFTVTFNVDGGSAVSSQEVLDGEKAEAPQNPTKLGFEFVGWFSDEAKTLAFDFDTPITADLTLYAKWNAVELPEMTVSFETNGGSEIADIKVLQGGTITLPAAPTKEGFIFLGWFTDQEFEHAFSASTPITADLTLYAKWQETGGGEVPEGTAIASALDFYNMATGSESFDLAGKYYLAADIDFTGFTWIPVSQAFTGELNGNGKTLRNLTMSNTTGTTYTGLFHILNGASIYNFTIENFNVTGNTRAAFVAGQVQGLPVTIDGIVIKNSTISGSVDYVGGIVGRVSGTDAQVHISNIVLDNVTIKGRYVAGIVADFNTDAKNSTISDIWAKITLAGRESDNQAERLGGIISRQRQSGGAVIQNIYLDITSTSDKWAGGIVGDAGSATLVKNAFVTGSMTAAGNSARSIAGNGAANVTVENTFEYLFTGTGSNGLGAVVVESAPDQNWWLTNLSGIAQSPLWAYKDGIYELVLRNGIYIDPEAPEPPVMFEVTFESNGGSAVADIEVEAGNLLELPTPPTREGFEFAGWFTDVDLLVAFNEENPINSDLTLYAKWVEAVEVPDGTPITTAQEFYTMATTNDEQGVFYLANDIDFTGFTWTGVAANFKGELNGNGKTLRNLNQVTTAVGVFNGLFHNLNGAKVYGFTIENFVFTSTVATTRSAIIAGQVSGQNPSYISDIVIRNSSISANQYVAAIVGRATGGTTSQVHISNIVLDNVTIRGFYVAGIIADIDSTSNGTTVTDIWAKVDIAGVEIAHGGSGLGLTERLGGIVSRSRASTTAPVIERVYMNITSTSDKWGAGIVADSNNATTVNNVFVTGTMTATNNSAKSIAGNNSSNVTVQNVFEYQFTGSGSSGLGATNVASLPNEVWWVTNLPSIASSDKWVFNEETGMFELKLLGSGEEEPEEPGEEEPVMFTVTFEVNGGSAVALVEVEDGKFLVLPTAPTRDGYIFLGWFTDVELQTQFVQATPITADLTLYAKWALKHTVHFESVGTHVADQTVANGAKASVVTSFLVGHTFKGWSTQSDEYVAFDLSSQVITNDITLYAFFEEIVEPEDFIGISSKEELLELFNTGGSGYYKLLNDLDFDGTPIAVSTSGSRNFSGVLDGDGHKLSNIVATASSNKQGVFFKQLHGGIIKNFVIENSSYTGGGEAAAFLVASVHGGSLIENIEFFNVSVTNTGAYTALIAGGDEGNTATNLPITFRNIIIRNYGDVKLQATGDYHGVVIGTIRNANVTLNMENIYVETTATTTGQTMGGIVGRLNGSNITVNISNAVVKANLTASKQVAGVLGQSANGNFVNINKVFITDSVFTQNETTVNAVVGNALGTQNITNAFYTATLSLKQGETDRPITQGTLIGSEDITQTWLEEKEFSDFFKVTDNDVVLNREIDVLPLGLLIDDSQLAPFYLVGDVFNHELFKVFLLYTDGSQIEIDLDDEDLEIDLQTVDMEAVGEYEITFTYQEFIKVYTLKVVEIMTIEIYEVDFVDVYLQGQSLNTQPVHVYATLSNDSLFKIDLENLTEVTDFNSGTPGVYSLSYTFLEFETQSLEVIVLANALVPVENEVVVYVDGSLESSDPENLTFKQVGQALQALKKSSLASSVRKVMYIADGLYFEKLTIDIPNLVMIGESREGTILDYNQASGNHKPEGGSWGTQGSASVSVKGAATGLTMARMTISNSFPYFDQNVVLADRQAVALVSEADKVLYYQVDFYGVQDTLYAKQGRQWYFDTYIEGAVDYIFGNGGPVFIEESVIHTLYRSNANGVITAFKGYNNTAADSLLDYGVVFYNNELTSENTTRPVEFGRPWDKDASVAYINNKIQSGMLSTNGWTDMSGNLPQNARFYEYGNTINDVVMPNTTYGKTLTELEANNWINKDVIFAQQNGLVNWGSTWNYQAQFDALQLLLD